MKMRYILLSLVVACLVAACGDGHYAPKPTAYLRLTFPPHAYQSYDTLPLPFTFELSQQASVQWKKNERGDKWLDLEYPAYGGVVFISYKAMRDRRDLAKNIDDSYEMLKTHYGIASGIDEQVFCNADRRVYATTNRLGGKNVASTYQFWATDSLHHFLHGSFYLDRTPNNDSLQPLIQYIQTDLDHMIETLQWRED